MLRLKSSEALEEVPIPTLYVSNLNEKVPVPQLKQALYQLFEQYGQILAIVAKRNILLRGQAFVIFRDLNSAMECKHSLAGRQFLGKTLKINYAKSKSKQTALRQGLPLPEARPQQHFKQRFTQKFINKKVKKDIARQRVKPIAKHSVVPNKTLFVEGLQPTVTAELLTQAFQRFPGLQDVRYMKSKKIAFVQYMDEIKAGAAMAGLNGSQLGSAILQITYAKK